MIIGDSYAAENVLTDAIQAAREAPTQHCAQQKVADLMERENCVLVQKPPQLIPEIDYDNKTGAPVYITFSGVLNRGAGATVLVHPQHGICVAINDYQNFTAVYQQFTNTETLQTLVYALQNAINLYKERKTHENLH